MKRGIRGLRIGIDTRWITTAADASTKQMMAAVLKNIAELGGDMHEVAFPDPALVIADWFPLCGVETAVAHERTYPSRKDEYGPALAGLIDMGRGVSGMDYQKIVLRRNDFRGRVQALFQTVDLLVIPTTGIASPTVAQMAALGENQDLIAALQRFTCPFDMTGSPTITLPAGFTAENTPIAFQFVSRHFEEDLLVRAGWAYQRVTHWHRQHPAL